MEALIPGIRTLAGRVMNMPVRTAQPEKLRGLADKLTSPAYSTSVGLLYWAADLQSLPASEMPRHKTRGQKK
jgi:cell division protein FtsA